MAKVSGSYASVVRGISQQIPEQRVDGQHGEQVNMLSDPVTGLTRRRGTVLEAETVLFSGAAAAKLQDHRNFRTKDFTVGLHQFTLLYRKKARPAGSDLLGLYCYNRSTQDFVPVTYAAGDTAVLAMLQAGVSAITQVGRYVLLAANNFLTQGTSADLYSPSDNSRYGAIWIRGGAYSRTFTVRVDYTGGTSKTATYTTPASSYPGTLDTSDIPASASDYQKQVNDRTNAYNTAVTQWIGTAAAAIQPSAIAESLRLALVDATVTGVTRSDAHLLFDDPNITGITVTDNGDGSLVRAVHQQIADAAQVTNMHRIGKIVKVVPGDDKAEFYLVARPKVPGATGWGQVIWEEGAAVSYTPGVWFMLGTVEGGSFHIASTPAFLATSTGLSVPDFNTRAVGDAESNKAPYFSGRPITFLATFQDRLVVGSGAVLNMSKIGDYFNFFRTSVLTVLDDDPAEVYALGGEDDTLRHSVIYNKSLLAFGDQRQYGISGRVPVTPKTTSVIQSSAHVDAADAAPVASGDLVFYTQRSDGYSRLFQMQTGDIDDTTLSSDVSNQLSTYMPGMPRNILATTSPSMVLIQTENAPRSVYTFRYLDIQGGRQRIQDAWSRWEFSEQCGDLMGMSFYQGQVLFFWSRVVDAADDTAKTFLCVDRLSLLSGRPTTPYLDSMRPYVDVMEDSPAKSLHSGSVGVASAYDRTTYAYLQGERDLQFVPEMLEEFPTVGTTGLWSGFQFDSYFEPTNPRIRDKNDVSIVNGRLTVTRIDVSCKETGGMLGTLTTEYGDQQVVANFNGRILGASNNLLDEQPVTTGSLPVFVGREVREYTLRLAAKDWLPFTVAGLEWTGQFFYNPRRV